MRNEKIASFRMFITCNHFLFLFQLVKMVSMEMNVTCHVILTVNLVVTFLMDRVLVVVWATLVEICVNPCAVLIVDWVVSLVTNV